MPEKINSAEFSNERDMKASDRERNARKTGRIPVWSDVSHQRRGGEVSAKAACAAPEKTHEVPPRVKKPVLVDDEKHKCEQISSELTAARSMIKSCLSNSELAEIFGMQDRPMLKICTVLILMVISFTLGFYINSSKKSNSCMR